MKPSVGRIVHFIYNGVHHAATIIKVWNDTCVSLAVLNDGTQNGFPDLFVKTSVVLDTQASQDYTWHWPENVQQTGEVRN